MNNFFNKKRITAVFISTVFASSILRVENVAAQEIEPESTKTEEVIEYSKDLKEQVENFSLNIEISADIEEKLEVALTNHLDGEFKEASKYYEEILGNLELNDKLHKALIKYFNMASNEVVLTEEDILAVIMEEDEYFLDNNFGNEYEEKRDIPLSDQNVSGGNDNEQEISENNLTESNAEDKETEQPVDEQSTIIEEDNPAEEYIEPESSAETNETSEEGKELESSPETKETSEDAKESEPSEEDEESDPISAVATTTYASNSADEMYEAVINAPNASSAWTRALEFKEVYPEDSRREEAINAAAQRISAMGKANHQNNDLANAIYYYELVLNEELVSESLKAEFSTFYAQALNNMELMTENETYEAVTDAPNASSAWDRAQDFKNIYPNSERLSEAFKSAGQRIYNMGISNHHSSNFSSAITYYNLLLNESLISPSIKNDVEFLKRQAQNKSTIIDADKTISESLNANTASEAWYIAYEGLEAFPNDTRFLDAIRKAADRIFSMGISNHNNGNFTKANSYYEMLVGSEYIDNNLMSKSEYYSYLASNNLYLTNIVVKNTRYNYSLNEAISTQMNIKNAKPQDSYNGGWRNATRAEVTQYINPENQLPKNNSDIENALTKIEITTGTLNVRTGPGINYPLTDTVHQGDIYSIADEQNGWYQIVINGSRGWISGNTSYVARDNSVLQFLVLSGSSGISVSDLNKELNNAGILKGHGNAFQEASKIANINELYLISHAVLETGYGTSNLAIGILVNEVDGKLVAPRIVYNMFGIGAVDSAPDKLGSERAYKEGWFSPREAIIGGAQWISNSYINNSTYKQDTLYKMRWNPERPGTHQYATDVAWANKQTNSLNSIVHLSKKYDLLLTFDIPIYN